MGSGSHLLPAFPAYLASAAQEDGEAPVAGEWSALVAFCESLFPALMPWFAVGGQRPFCGIFINTANFPH